MKDMVDLVGIEPTTSSMPWNEEKRFGDGKGLNSRPGVKKPA